MPMKGRVPEHARPDVLDLDAGELRVRASSISALLERVRIGDWIRVPRWFGAGLRGKQQPISKPDPQRLVVVVGEVELSVTRAAVT